MNIQQLEYLIAVDKYKHFGKAAQACFITQPTLSAMIQNLKKSWISRFLTVQAILFIYNRCQSTNYRASKKKIIDDVMELRNRANLLNNIVSGKINLGIIPTVSAFLLPNEIFDFLRRNPKIEMNVKEMTTENVIKALKSGEIDAGIISTPYAAADEFFSDFLYNEELLIYSSNKDLNKDGDSFIIPEDIDLEDVWLLSEGNCLRTQVENICKLKENELKPSNLDFKASSVNTLVQMVDRVGGLTVIPEMAVDHLTEGQREKVFHFRKPYPKREISLIYYKPTYKQNFWMK